MCMWLYSQRVSFFSPMHWCIWKTSSICSVRWLYFKNILPSVSLCELECTWWAVSRVTTWLSCTRRERERERAIFTQFLVQHFPLTLSTSCPLQPHSCWLDDDDDVISNCAGLIVCVTKLVCFRSIWWIVKRGSRMPCLHCVCLGYEWS